MKPKRLRNAYGPSEYMEACNLSSLVFDGCMSRNDAIAHLSNFGINPTSANDFIEIYNSLAIGKSFLRGTSASAIDYFVKFIIKNNGIASLPKVIQALTGHIAKMMQSGSKMIAMKMVLDKYKQLEASPMFSHKVQQN